MGVSSIYVYIGIVIADRVQASSRPNVLMPIKNRASRTADRSGLSLTLTVCSGGSGIPDIHQKHDIVDETLREGGSTARRCR